MEEATLNKRDNYITIGKELVIEERQRGEGLILSDIDFRIPTSRRVKYTAINRWGHDANVYMQIRYTNFVIMHVRDNLCVIIPRKVISEDGRCIDVVERLKQYYFSINKKGYVCTLYNGRWYKLYRMLYALMMYGDERILIPHDYEVHHKWWRYINILECMTLMTKNKHDAIHKKISKKSHRKGKIIRNHKALMEFIRELKAEIEFWKNREY